MLPDGTTSPLGRTGEVENSQEYEQVERDVMEEEKYEDIIEGAVPCMLDGESDEPNGEAEDVKTEVDE